MAQKQLETTHAFAGKSKRGPNEPIARRGVGSMGSGAFWGVVIASTVGLVMLLAPISLTGIWDPVELRIADLAARVSSSLFHANLGDAGMSPALALPTLGELGRGELPYTSIALGFRLFGLHDWAGRLPLALWSAFALVAMVTWIRRYVGNRAAIWSAFVFPTLPIVFLQARFMLGDATTMASQFACFTCLSMACFDGPTDKSLKRRIRWIWFGLSLLAGFLGVLSRGILIGIAVPFLAVGFASCGFEGKRPSTEPKFGLLVALPVGIAALVAAVYAALRTGTVRGIWLVLRGANYQADFHPHSFDAAIAQLGHGLFPWSGFALFALIAVFFEVQRATTTFGSAKALLALIGLVFLTAAAQTWLGGFGVSMPFPAVVALVAIIGTALESLSRQKKSLRLVSLGTVAILVVLLADFENTPDKILVATASPDAHIPASFRNDSFRWIQGSCAAIFGISAALGFGLGKNTRGSFRRQEITRLVGAFKVFLRSQIGFYVLLIQTALMTGAALFWVTRFGVPLQRIRDLMSPQRELLAWSWLILPALGATIVLGRGVLAALDFLFSPGFGLLFLAGGGSRFAGWANRVLQEHPALRDVIPKRNTAWSAGLVIVAATFSLGWGSTLGLQLSPRRALSQYDSLSKSREPLGLLGVRPQIIQYYSRQRPELLADSDEAADWMLYGKGTTRWLIVKGDQMARLNASYRERCKCQQNVPIVDARPGDMLLAVNHRVDGIASSNPFDDIVLSHVPSPQQVLDADLGGQVEVLGWELRSRDGKSVPELRVGRTYELRLYFKVLSRPTMDWETFVHIDGYGRRYNGDHDTTQGRYPTSNWRQGDIVVDSSDLVLDPSFSHGNYQLYFGFYKGSRRLEVRRGRQDENRIIAGTIRVR